MPSHFKLGTWNAICSICGRKKKSDQLKKNWKGFYVCKEDWETRQPLDSIRARTDKQSVPWSRPQTDDTFITECYLWEISSYADLATADCATADTTTFSYAYLLALRNGTS